MLKRDNDRRHLQSLILEPAPETCPTVLQQVRKSTSQAFFVTSYATNRRMTETTLVMIIWSHLQVQPSPDY